MLNLAPVDGWEWWAVVNKLWTSAKFYVGALVEISCTSLGLETVRRRLSEVVVVVCCSCFSTLSLTLFLVIVCLSYFIDFLTLFLSSSLLPSPSLSSFLPSPPPPLFLLLSPSPSLPQGAVVDPLTLPSINLNDIPEHEIHLIVERMEAGGYGSAESILE